MEHKYTIREITKSASRALSAVYTKFLSCGGMSFDVYTKLYKTLIEPVLLHGAGLWGHNNWREVQTIQNKACRLFMGSSSNASNIAVLGDMGFKTTKSAELLETYRLFLRVRYTYDYRITHKVHMWGMNISRSWDKKCCEIAHKLGIYDIIDSQYSNRHKMYDIKTKLYEIEKQEWVEKLYQDRNEPNGNKLRTYRLYKNVLETSSYLKNVNDRQHRRILSNFRSGSQPLAIETGRYTKPKTLLNDRKCKYCTVDCVEDEKHFLMHCEFYSDLRYGLYLKASAINPNFLRF